MPSTCSFRAFGLGQLGYAGKLMVPPSVDRRHMQLVCQQVIKNGVAPANHKCNADYDPKPGELMWRINSPDKIVKPYISSNQAPGRMQ
jgi:hypothetical protein